MAWCCNERTRNTALHVLRFSRWWRHCARVLAPPLRAPVDADTSRKIGDAIAAKGGRFLEAPVSGSKKPAIGALPFAVTPALSVRIATMC